MKLRDEEQREALRTLIELRDRTVKRTWSDRWAQDQYVAGLNSTIEALQVVLSPPEQPSEAGDLARMRQELADLRARVELLEAREEQRRTRNRQGRPVNRAEGAYITGAAIARLARVSRSAVANWRTRYPDFPANVEPFDPPQFQRAAVVSWLERHGKLASEQQETAQ